MIFKSLFIYTKKSHETCQVQGQVLICNLLIVYK